jgi:hypothetical protein
MVELGKQDGMAASVLRFAILTAARTGEAIGARWSEIDLPAAVWTIPPERIKAGREHRVPLSDAALAVLGEAAKLRQDGPDAPVFPAARSGKPLSNMALLMLLRRMGRDDLTAHGFRSTFRDWAAETGWPDDLAEAALGRGPLVLLDFDQSPMTGTTFATIAARVAEPNHECRAQYDGVLSAIWAPEPLSKQIAACGLPSEPIPPELLADPAVLALGASGLVANGAVKMAAPAHDKARDTPLIGALTFRAGEPMDADPLRLALLVGIAIGTYPAHLPDAA